MCIEAAILIFFPLMFLNEAATHNADMDGKSDKCVVKIMMEDILAHSSLLPGQKGCLILQTRES